jgi:hypothetical protein
MADPYFVANPDWFAKPLDAAIVADTDAIEKAAARWKGSEARTHTALDESEALDDFCTALGAHLRSKTFHLLPAMHGGGMIFASVSVLEKPPWRGVFLIRADGSSVAGLLFSKYPHDNEARLAELIADAQLGAEPH